MSSADASRPGRFVWGGVELPLEITLKGIKCEYNNSVNEPIFNQPRYLIATPRMEFQEGQLLRIWPNVF